MDVPLAGEQLAPLERLYRDRCKDAGSIAMFSLSRDDDCASAREMLDRLALVAAAARLRD
jgi:hypothetical protein